MSAVHFALLARPKHKCPTCGKHGHTKPLCPRRKR